MSAPLILPDSRCQDSRNQRVLVEGVWYVKLYCPSCGRPGGAVPEKFTTFATYICNVCLEKWGKVDGAYIEPDAAFFERVAQYQLEKKGRPFTPLEIVKELDDQNSALSKLAREAPKGGKR